MTGKHKIKIITLGCSKNVVDSEKLLRQIKAGGCGVVNDEKDNSADTVLINTCGFINDAREESIDTILQQVLRKKTGSIGSLYVFGCLSQRYRDQLKTEIPEVDGWYGVDNAGDILKELNIRFVPENKPDRMLSGPGHYAYLKISEGCSRACSFCAIPQIRGRYISRPVEDVVEEAYILAGKGVKELILIAQDLSYYGTDLYNKPKLPRLVEELLKIESFEWIRLHYLYPAAINYDLIPLIKANSRICRYIDIPVQHITDRMLGLMKRSHNRKDTEALLVTLRDELPDAAIRTTLIAGHPGETKEDFSELKKFVSDFRFNRLGVFAYSHEEGTYSCNSYKDDISPGIKASRVSELMEIQQEISAGMNRLLTGKTLKVIIDGREGAYFTGRTEHDSPEIDQEVLISSDFRMVPGNYYNIRITRSAEYDLFGIPV